MRIRDRGIGAGEPPYVIAELGVNHDGSEATLHALINAAANAGADAVKLQLFRADDLLAAAAPLAGYQRRSGEDDAASMLRRLELSLDAARGAIDAAHAAGLHAIATVFDLPLVASAAALPLDAFKTASPDIVHRPLLDALAATGRPLIASTGAATREEVARAIGWLRPARQRLAVLQCVSAYPTPSEHAAVAALHDLATLHDGPVGYSDHTADADTGALAVALGAHVLEKHLTLDRTAPGPDHAASIEPAEMAEYVRLAHAASKGDWTHDPGDPRLGSGRKAVLDIEADVRRVARRSIVAARSLDVGVVLRAGDLAFKRPGGGLEPWQDGDLLGRALAVDVAADQPLSLGHLL
ncbi:MAG: N-acetylneuraminate synthase family protein [Planctomycetota bacterium]